MSYGFYHYTKSMMTEEVGRADAAVIFFHDWGEENGLSAETVLRLEHAKGLYNRGLVSTLICVGGGAGSSMRERGVTGARLMCRYLNEMGVLKDDLLADERSFDSLSNLRSLADICIEQRYKNLIFVSSASHLYRLQFFWEESSIKIAMSPHGDQINTNLSWYLQKWWSIQKEWISFTLIGLLSPAEYQAFTGWWRSVDDPD